MDSQDTAQPSKKDIKRAEEIWQGFTGLMKWSVITSVVVLALLGVIFIDW